MNVLHMGRSWTGHDLEDSCPCDKAPCGLVLANRNTRDCPEHGLHAAKTMRQAHYAELCPALAQREQWQYAGRATHCGIEYHQWVCPAATGRGLYVVPADWYALTTLGAGTQ